MVVHTARLEEKLYPGGQYVRHSPCHAPFYGKLTWVEPKCDRDDDVETYMRAYISRRTRFTNRGDQLTHENHPLEPIRLAVRNDIAHCVHGYVQNLKEGVNKAPLCKPPGHFENVQQIRRGRTATLEACRGSNPE